MKNCFTNTLLAVAVLASTAVANDEIKRRDNTRSDDYRSDTISKRADRQRLGRTAKASDLIGATIRNNSNDKIGTVEEMTVDITSGRVLEVVVSVGGFLGVGDRHVSVPPQAFTVDGEGKEVRLDAGKEKLKGAPEVTLSKWQPDWDTDRLTRVYSYYGQEPVFYDDKATMDRKGTKVPDVTRHVARASKLVGQTLEDREGENLGKIDDLIVDLTGGRAVFAVISTGGFLGLGDQLSAIPVTVLRHKEGKANQSAIYFDASRERLSQAPHFNKSEWPKWDEDYAIRVYQAQDLEPYFSARPTGRDSDHIPLVREAPKAARDEEPLRERFQPAQQGTAPEDMATTTAIRKDISAEKGLSVSARNVRVTTMNGKVTLQGAVDTHEEKKKLAEIVKRHTHAAEVSNQLEIKAQSK